MLTILLLQAHCRAFVIKMYLKTILTEQFTPELMAVLTQLGQLICTHWILNRLGDFLQVFTFSVVCFYFDMK